MASSMDWKVIRSLIVIVSIAAICVYAAPQQTQPPGPDKATIAGHDETEPTNTTESLQKATQNPVADLISVPLQNNANLSYGSFNRTQDVLEIEPVIPIKLSDNWNLITRTIQPLVWQPYPNQNTGGEYGLGDMNPSFFLSPGKPGKLIWGAGPALVIPTATSTVLGQGKLSIGPSVVLLTQPPHWTLGLLINNVWSVAGSVAGRMSIRCCCSTSSTTT